MKSQRGFTLIELVVVIIMLGILAAVAVPKFVDLSADARTAAAKGVAGSLSAATSINYAALAAGNPSGVVLDAANVCTVAHLQPFVAGLTLSAGPPTSDDMFQVSPGQGSCATATSVTCLITPKGSKATPIVTPIICARG